MPVDPGTVDKWIHPPYSGHFDGERIWGRGTADDKNGLIAILFVSRFILVSASPNSSVEQPLNIWYLQVSSQNGRWSWRLGLTKSPAVWRCV